MPNAKRSYDPRRVSDLEINPEAGYSVCRDDVLIDMEGRGWVRKDAEVFREEDHTLEDPRIYRGESGFELVFVPKEFKRPGRQPKPENVEQDLFPFQAMRSFDEALARVFA